MCRWLFLRFYWNSKWPPQINFNFFLGGGVQKLKKLFGQFFLKFQYHIPSNMGRCKWFFKDITEIQNGRQSSNPNFFVGAKTLKPKVRNYSNFPITFPTIWRCAGDYFKVLLKIKMATTDQLYKKKLGGGGAKTKTKCLVNFFEILTSHS